MTRTADDLHFHRYCMRAQVSFGELIPLPLRKRPQVSYFELSFRKVVQSSLLNDSFNTDDNHPFCSSIGPPQAPP